MDQKVKEELEDHWITNTFGNMDGWPLLSDNELEIKCQELLSQWNKVWICNIEISEIIEFLRLKWKSN